MNDVVTEALTRTWTEIRKRYPAVPDLAICVTSGSSQTKCGSQIWGNTRLLVVNDEILGRNSEAVLAWLLHQAAHELAGSHRPSSNVNYTARHDQAFHDAAIVLGLEIEEPDPRGGSSITSMPQTLIDRYGFAILRIRQACANHSSPNFKKALAICQCVPPRLILMAPTAPGETKINCQICMKPFKCAV
jgi:hypothetical protein